MNKYDVCIIGGGASGLLAASLAGAKGKSVILIEHNREFGRKILISGGGRCNFTNINATPTDFQSSNKHFFKSALSRYTPDDFMKLIDKYRIKWFEKKDGQLFCENSAKEIRDMLVRECQHYKVELRLSMSVESIFDRGEEFSLETSDGAIQCKKLVIATGGLSIPPIGATDFGYLIAKQYGHKIVQTDPALVPFTMEKSLSELSGVSLPVLIKTGKEEIEEDLLFTHKGMSGPAVLKISLYWHPGERVKIDFTKGMKVENIFTQSKKNVLSVLSDKFPKRFIEMVLAEVGVDPTRSLSELSKKDQNRIYEFLSNYNYVPSGTEGFRKAEVTRGGVNVKDISSQTMESKLRSGLYFIGEVLDVTGQLGGYNFQWAWASAYAFAESLE